MAHLLYYAPSEGNITKQISFLIKNDYDVIKCFTSLDVIQNFVGTSLVITTREDILELVVSLSKEVPILVLSKPNTVLNYKEIPNKIFYRTETDPLFTLLETVKFLTKA